MSATLYAVARVFEVALKRSRLTVPQRMYLAEMPRERRQEPTDCKRWVADKAEAFTTDDRRVAEALAAETGAGVVTL